VEVLEGSLEGKHLVITCTLTVNNQEIPTNMLIECGAIGVAFMDQDFTRDHQILLHKITEKTLVKVIDRRPSEGGDIAQISIVGMTIHDHKKQLPIFVTKLGHYPIVLGMSWLRLEDVAMSFASNTVTVKSHHCMTHCHDGPVTVQGVIEEPLEPLEPV